jgi:TonB-linked outer membrane protein, SusC/RagA family
MLCLFMAMGLVHAFAQNRTITGRVTDAKDGSPLPGVTVKIAKTSLGTLTNAKGEYSLTVPDNAPTLEFSFIGFDTRQVAIEGRTSISVDLNANEKSLNEVVVVGYGTVERRDLTGSVSSLKGNVLKDLATSSVDRQLAGQVTGVQVNVSSGILGQPARIRIRGTNSISSSSDPLYVVDGVPYITGSQSSVTANNPLGDINPNDIESMEVLKDGSATAIYGSRAANGVILITTRKGKLGKPKVTYDAWFASAAPSKRFDLLNADEFIQVVNEKYENAGRPVLGAPTLDPSGKPYDTDWQDIVLRRAFQHNHSLSFSGATEQTNYYFSVGYANLQGTTVGNDQTKYQFRAKLEQKALDILTFGFNSGISYVTNNGLNTGTNALSGNLTNAIRALPNVPAQFADGSYNINLNGNTLGQGGNGKVIDDNYTNIKFVLDNNVYRNRNLNIVGDAFVDAQILKGLNFRSQIGINLLNGEDYQYWNPVHGDGRSSNGYIYQQSLPRFRYNWFNTLSYNKTIGSSKLNVVAGIEFQKTQNRSFNSQGTNLSGTYFAGDNIISSTLASDQIGGTFTEQAFRSYFGRANYSFKDRYLLAATFRRDAISALPWGSQNASLPGVSIGWRISEEPFFKNAAALHFVSNLKLRGGWAKVGNVEIGSYPYAGTFKPVPYGANNGLAFGQIANPGLTFETSKKYNAGIDLGFLDNRITFTADYFRNDVDKLILAAPVPPSLGVPSIDQPNILYVNAGQMRNKGFEFAISSVNISTADFTWSSSLNVTFVKNNVTQLYNNADLIDAYNITKVGYSIGSFFGYESAGVNSANGNPLWVKGDGSIVQGDIRSGRYYAYDPSKPGDITTPAAALTLSDKKILGQSNPTWFGGLNNTFTYKGFDLNIFLSFAGGNKVYNVTRQESLNNQKFQNNSKELLNSWKSAGDVTDVPMLYYGSDNFVLQNGNLNSRFLEDGKFLRAQNIGLGYTVPEAFAQRMRLSRLRVYAQVQNAFVITGYSGLDPELNNMTLNASNAAVNRQVGIDYNTNPVPRTITFGINVGF